MDIKINDSFGEVDEQAEEQWTRVTDKEWLLAEKRGFKSKKEYLEAKRQIEVLDRLRKELRRRTHGE
tara:strand:+ start:612 stop:812 length:201 start_codon:yes stop_codon:yes gene_type:complete